MHKRKNKKENKLLIWLILIGGLLIILLLLLFLKIYIENKKENKAIDVINKEKEIISSISSMDYNNKNEYLKEEYSNKDVIGILSIPDIDLYSIITKSNDNKYYLDHDIYKKESIFGNPFLDYRNNITDKQINIYGHNSVKYDTPFKKLETFLKNNKSLGTSIYLETENNKYTYSIVAVKTIIDDYEHLKINFNMPDGYKKHYDSLLENSIYKVDENLTEQADIIILQTCLYTNEKSYLLVIGKKIKTE